MSTVEYPREKDGNSICCHSASSIRMARMLPSPSRALRPLAHLFIAVAEGKPRQGPPHPLLKPSETPRGGEYRSTGIV